MRLRHLLLIAVLLPSPLLAAKHAAAPATMTRITVRFESPDIPKGSFAGLAKTIYRAGTRYCRSEEMPDPDHNIHGLFVINEPNAWMVNLVNRSGVHLVDKGKTHDCILPIEFGKNDLHSNLQFGNEIAFFKVAGATVEKGPAPGTMKYTLPASAVSFTLYTTGTPERPYALRRQQGSDARTFIYTDYTVLPFDAKLFAKPKGIKMREGKEAGH